MTWRRFVQATGVVLIALVLASFSGSLYQRRSSQYVVYQAGGAGIDSMRVVVGGWPIAYLYDKPYAFSPANVVNFSDGLRGIDAFDLCAFGGDVVFFGLLIVVVGFVIHRFQPSER